MNPTTHHPHASRLTPHASRFTLHVPRFTLHVPRFTPHASRLALLTLLALARPAAAATPNFSTLVYPGPDGKLLYKPSSEKGDTLPDFSNCGFKGGGVRLPDAPVKITLQPDLKNADDTARIQKAIDELSKMPLAADGLRGALLLSKGQYRIHGSLRIAASGVVIRGVGQTEDDTVLLGTGKRVRRLIEIGGASGAQEVKGTRQKITSSYVPVGAHSFEIGDGSKFKVGDSVIVSRIGNAAWIHEIGMDQITPRPADPTGTKQWKPFNLGFDRVITAIEGKRVTVDAPIVCAIDKRWGGGEIYRCTDAGRIEQAGVENLRAVSEFDASVTKEEKGKAYPADEEHANWLVGFNNVKNAWARDLTALHFYHGVSSISGGAKWVTVQDSSSLDPVSVITGGRRYPFSLEGQLCLVQRCYSRNGRHAFVLGARVPGPNVFLDCHSEQDHATSEPHHRWSVGGLYDNPRAQIAIQDRQWMGSGHGWAGANYVVWNSEGSLICQQPPTAQNFAIGHLGTKGPGAFPRPQGHWESLGQHVEPRSLYLQQLEDRLGGQATKAIAR